MPLLCDITRYTLTTLQLHYKVLLIQEVTNIQTTLYAKENPLHTNLFNTTNARTYVPSHQRIRSTLTHVVQLPTGKATRQRVPKTTQGAIQRHKRTWQPSTTWKDITTTRLPSFCSKRSVSLLEWSYPVPTRCSPLSYTAIKMWLLLLPVIRLWTEGLDRGAEAYNGVWPTYICI